MQKNHKKKSFYKGIRERKNEQLSGWLVKIY